MIGGLNSHSHSQSLALAMRVGIIKMGGFLHSVFDGIERSTKRLEQDYTAARLLLFVDTIVVVVVVDRLDLLFKLGEPDLLLFVCLFSLPINEGKNRQGAPLPPGHTRVKMNFSNDLLGSEYINARYTITI